MEVLMRRWSYALGHSLLGLVPAFSRHEWKVRPAVRGTCRKKTRLLPPYGAGSACDPDVRKVSVSAWQPARLTSSLPPSPPLPPLPSACVAVPSDLPLSACTPPATPTPTSPAAPPPPPLALLAPPPDRMDCAPSIASADAHMGAVGRSTSAIKGSNSGHRWASRMARKATRTAHIRHSAAASRTRILGAVKSCKRPCSFPLCSSLSTEPRAG
eukprot:362548-Chlamydomonas_euryale.AAC.16